MAIEYSLDPTRNTVSGLPENPLGRQIRELTAERDRCRASLAALLLASEAHERAEHAVEFGAEECRSLDEYNARVDALRAAADALHAAQRDARRTGLS